MKAYPLFTVKACVHVCIHVFPWLDYRLWKAVLLRYLFFSFSSITCETFIYLSLTDDYSWSDFLCPTKLQQQRRRQKFTVEVKITRRTGTRSTVYLGQAVSSCKRRERKKNVSNFYTSDLFQWFYVMSNRNNIICMCINWGQMQHVNCAK